jgi:hypothetical protein
MVHTEIQLHISPKQGMLYSYQVELVWHLLHLFFKGLGGGGGGGGGGGE